MPRKKRLSKHNPHKITSAAVEAFLAGDRDALYFALDLQPWIPHPLDMHPSFACPYPRGTGGADHWPLAVRLRAELLAAASLPPESADDVPELKPDDDEDEDPENEAGFNTNSPGI